MSHCFLSGSKTDSNLQHPLRIHHYIEYLTLNIESKTVEIVGDFIIENVDSEPASLLLLHRGNIKLTNKSSQWPNDNYWTKILLKYGYSEIGIELKDKNNIVLSGIGISPISVHLLPGSLSPWGPTRPTDGTYIPYSVWQSPEVDPGLVALLRVEGTMGGKSYDYLLSDSLNEKHLTIRGGETLVSEIDEDIQSDKYSGYINNFALFKSKYYDKPAYYHVFFERKGKKSLKVTSMSSDMIEVFVNKSIGNGRHVNWFWSDSDFNILACANGPIVELANI